MMPLQIVHVLTDKHKNETYNKDYYAFWGFLFINNNNDDNNDESNNVLKS